MKQSGFLSGIALYAVLGLGAATLLAGGWGWIQGKRLELAKLELADCTIRYEQTLALVERQNHAIQTLKEEAEKRTRMAQAALLKAEQGVTASRQEISRLRALRQPDGATCPSGEAVKQIRAGVGSK